MNDDIHCVFVYGTLKRGEARAAMWPYEPIRLDTGTVRGQLYDLGAFPAMKPGSDIVSGEVRWFKADDMPLTLEVLDEIEGYRGLPDDLYRRVVMKAQLDNGESIHSYVYLFNDEPNPSTRIEPGVDGHCRWPR